MLKVAHSEIDLMKFPRNTNYGNGIKPNSYIRARGYLQ